MTTTDFNPFTSDVAAELKRLRDEHGATCWSNFMGPGQPVLMVLADETCREVLIDTATYSSTLAMGGTIAASNPDDVMEALPDFCRDTSVTGVVDVDPPRHKLLRRNMNAAYRLPWVRAHARVAQSIADETAEQLTDHDQPELVAHYARPYIQSTIGAAFGLPAEILPQFLTWSEDMRTIVSPPQAVPGGEDTKRLAANSLHDYVAWATPWIESQRGTGSIIDTYAHGDLEAEPIGLNNTLYSLLVHYVAGTVTTMHGLASAIDHAARNRTMWVTLSRDADYTAKVFEEALRMAAPHRGLIRVTTTETTLDGHDLTPGTLVLPMLQSAGRDPQHHPNPDQFDTDRHRRRDHLAFGHGAHRCSGSELGRSNGSIGLETLARHYPGLTLAGDYAPIGPDFFFHGPEALPVHTLG